MNAFIVVWVLFFGLHQPNGITVPGIASEEACNELADAINADRWIGRGFYRCYPYKMAVK